jgi:hypothetical protein
MSLTKNCPYDGAPLSISAQVAEEAITPFGVSGQLGARLRTSPLRSSRSLERGTKGPA